MWRILMCSLFPDISNVGFPISCSRGTTWRRRISRRRYYTSEETRRCAFYSPFLFRVSTDPSDSTTSSNYEQLGLKFRLFSAEVLFNKGLSQIYMGRTAEGLTDMQEAARDKATDEHNVIDDAIQDRGEGYTVFSIVSQQLPQQWTSLSIPPPESLSASFTGLLRRNSRTQ
jgi:hypothetical protein